MRRIWPVLDDRRRTTLPSGSGGVGVGPGTRPLLASAMLAANLPIGAESDFIGVVDLIGERAMVWEGETELGAQFEERPVPEALLEAVASAREVLIDALSEQDEKIVELFLEGEEIADEVAELLDARHDITEKEKSKAAQEEFEEQVPIAVGASAGAGGP